MKDSDFMQTIEQAFLKLEKSKFRSSFKLKEKDREYVKNKGMDTIRSHASDFVRVAVFLQHRLSGIVQQGLGCPLLAPADLHDSLLDGADQCLVLAAFRPQDLLFDHRDIDHMKMIMVDFSPQSFGHGAIDLVGVHDGGEDILLTAHDLDRGFVGIRIELLGELVAAVIIEIGRVDIEDKLAVVGGI